ncbi:hypothetical protein SDC9_59058 [bioreactor metagenome]|uniref:Copper amine oxidase-like N-terminal domain-containing protein n=1 Tax=bioreactor metagenome TaxID=1076179 RepID=A0A644XEX4_9ZZZZ
MIYLLKLPSGLTKGIIALMKKKLSLCLAFILLLSVFPVLAWDRSGDYTDFSAGYASDGEVILRDFELTEDCDNYSYSYDGVNWKAIEYEMPSGGELTRLVPYNGRSFMILGSQFGLCYASEDGIHWEDLSGRSWFENSGIGRGITDFYFQWTGSEYIMCQNINDTGGMYGFGAKGPSPRNSVVCFLDENFDETGEYDFGVDVADVGYAYGIYYAKTSGDEGTAVYSSADKKAWVKTLYSEIPEETPLEFKVTHEGDSFSGGLLFRASNGNVLVSGDGVSFGTLGSVPESSWLETSPESATTLVKAFVGRDGAVVTGTYTMNGYLYSNGSATVYPRAQLSEAIASAAPIYSAANTYAADGNVIVRKETFENENETRGCLAWSYDGINWTPVREAGGEAFPGDALYLLPYNGKTFFALGIFGKFACTSKDGITWSPLSADWFQENASFIVPGYGWNLNLYRFLWTGSEYMMCQNIFNDPHGALAGTWQSPRNTKVTFLDGDFNLAEEYDFGIQVSGVGFAGGTYYAETGDGESAVIWSSPDRKTWAQTSLEEIPEDAGGNFLTTSSGDLAAPPYLFRVGADGALRVSKDAVYWSLPLDFPGKGVSVSDFEAFVGRDAVIFRYSSGTESCFLRSALDDSLPDHPIYVTLDGSYLSFDVQPLADSEQNRVLAPLRGIAEALGFTVTWESGENLAVCAKGDTQVTVSIGSPDAWVNGAHQTLEAPARAENSRTYVPIRFLAEAFGLSVNWKQDTRTVVLTRP